jgi:hypothetical protein
MPTTHAIHTADCFDRELESAITDLDTLKGVTADGNVDYVSGDSEPSHRSSVSICLHFSGYDVREDLKAAITRLLEAL